MNSRNVMVKEFIYQLALGGIDEIDEIKQKIDELNIDLELNNLVVVVVDTVDYLFLFFEYDYYYMTDVLR